MSDGSITFSTNLDNKKLQSQLNNTMKKIDRLNDKLYQKKSEHLPLVEQSAQLAVNLDAAKAKLAQMQSGKEFFPASSIEGQVAAVKELEGDWNRTQKKVEQYDATIQSATAELGRSEEKAGVLQRELARAGGNTLLMGKAMDKAQKSVSRFSMRLREVARSALIFTVITQSLAAFRDWMGKVVRTNDEASQAMARLKGALLTLAQPLVNVIIPAFTTLVNILAQVIDSVAKVMAALFGTTIDESRKAAEELYNETEALDGVGGAAKKAAKSMAAFDEVNQLSEGDKGGGTGGRKGTEVNPDFGGLGDLPYKEKLDEITAYVSGALLAVGAILALSGVNIPLGIALMAVGAIGLVSVVSENWGAMTDTLRQALTTMLVLAGIAALAIGAILCLSGVNIPLGISLLAVGAAALVAAASLNWGNMSESVKTSIKAILEILGTCLLVVGAVLAFSGANIPLGIGLMVAGAAALAASVALNWSSVQGNVKGTLTELLLLLGSALLAVGAVMALSGINLPLGIGLMAAGAVALCAAAALNWNAVVTAVQGPLGGVMAALGIALLAVGAILCLSGAGIPLGIGLLLAGGASLGTAVALNWDWMLNKIKEVCGKIKDWWSNNMAKYFTLEYWTGLGRDMLAGLIQGLSNFGTSVKTWGNDMLDKVKAFFGIHSPSTEFETLGKYMMSGLEQGVSNNAATVEAFRLLFAAICRLCTENVNAMQLDHAAFLLYLRTEFCTGWNKTWVDCATSARQNISQVLTQISALNAALASIERNIVITITTVRVEAGSGSSSSGGKNTSSKAAPRLASLPIPALARGAVIPPNREFLAVLGDQKSGANIEAPESLLRQIYREELGANTAVLRAILAAIKDGKVMMVDGEKFARLVYGANKSESRRVGISLATGG